MSLDAPADGRYPLSMSFDPDAPASGDQLFGLPVTPDDARVVVVPVPWEATTSYRRGTRGAPAKVHDASFQVDLHDLEVGDAWRAGFALAEEDPDFAAWDAAAEADALVVIGAGGDREVPGVVEAAARVNALSERMNERVHAHVRAILARGAVPGVLGGDHSVPFGAMRAVAERHPGVGVLHVDAHADLRAAYEGFTWSHASIFHNVLTRLPGVARVVQVGLRDVGAGEVAFARAQGERVRWFSDVELAGRAHAGEPWRTTVAEIVDALPDEVYVSFDIDGLDPALCLTTGTPVPGGLGWRDALALLAEVGRRRRVVGFDLVEVGPGEWDAIVGARLLYKLCAWAARVPASRS